VLDGGPTLLGLESTIIDVTGSTPRLLRPGGLAAEEIEAALGAPFAQRAAERHEGPQLAPGMLPTHYAPRTPLVLIVGSSDAARARLKAEVERALAAGQRVGVLLLQEDHDLAGPSVEVGALGSWADPISSAARLFDVLRRLDRAHLDVIFARQLADPGTGLGRALADRLSRASGQVIEA
jgi:L-threonylcarbamoyladenylate synthase